MINKKFNFNMKVLPKHLDGFGHVNNAVYLEFLEQARWDILNSHKMGMESIVAEQKGPVVLEINIKYRKELKANDLIEIESSVQESTTKIIKMSQIIKKDGEESAIALITIGLMDLVERRLIDFNATWQKALGIN